jgi:hypothetical protein
MQPKTEQIDIDDPTRGRAGAQAKAPAAQSIPDPRHIRNGWEIPTESYSDQPYIVKTDDGAWLCVLTTGAGREGETGQHVITLRSTDQGKTWSAPVPLEQPSHIEASYAVLLKTPGGRVYCFYNHNTDDVRWIIADNPPYPEGKCYRVDSMGYFVFKYSDDHGQSWSSQRYVVPIREMAIDRENPYGGKIRFFWNVGRPFTHEGTAYVSVHKVGGIGHGFFTRSEGVLVASDNILTESDPEKIRWETLPDGDAGLRAPAGGGPIAEEQSYSVLSDGAFYCVYRTIDGHPAFSYSRDNGHTWAAPQYKRYANGRLMKHPRAANFAWKCENGHFIYWFHNHGGNWYEDRNPVWLCGGVEVDTPEGRVIQWSQPEIAIYDDDPYIRMSYPDLVEEGGSYYLTETQKDIARVHLIDKTLLEGMWGQFAPGGSVTREGCILELAGSLPASAQMPRLPLFTRRDNSRHDYGTGDLRAGFSLELGLRLDSLQAGQIILDKRSASGQGFCLQTTGRGTVEIVLNDGRTDSRWDTDPGALVAGRLHHLVVVVDGGPKIISFIVDGVLCDGGDFRQYGWGRFNPHLRHVHNEDIRNVVAPGNSATSPEAVRFDATQASQPETIHIAPHMQGAITLLRVYNRYLRTSEAISNYKAGLQA